MCTDHKTCGRCGELKSCEAFPTRKYPSGEVGRRSYCKVCKVGIENERHKQPPYAEKRRAYETRARAERPELRDKLTQRSKDAYWRNAPNRRAAEVKKYYEQRETMLWRAARKRAEKKGLPFDIEPCDIVIPETCPMLGTPMITPSVDRVVNHLGYVKGNVKVVDRNSNRLKSNATVEQLEKIVAYMKEFACAKT